MPAIGYVATGSALFFSALLAGSYAFGTADESTGVASREATVAYSQASNQAPEANRAPEKAKREHVRVISISADASAASSDGMPWYARTMQPPRPPHPAKNSRTVSVASQGQPHNVEKARTKRRTRDVRPREVVERTPAAREAYAAAYDSVPERRPFFPLFGR